jgi:hypothetical protein
MDPTFFSLFFSSSPTIPASGAKNTRFIVNFDIFVCNLGMIGQNASVADGGGRLKNAPSHHHPPVPMKAQPSSTLMPINILTFLSHCPCLLLILKLTFVD